MFDLNAVQESLAEFGLDGWLLYDFRGSNVLARRVLGLPEKTGTRRFFYFIPVKGEPEKLVHRIESGALDNLPGDKTVYLTWQELEGGVASLLKGVRQSRHGVFTESLQPVCVPRRRRGGGVGSNLGRRDRFLGRPDPALRSDLG